LWNSVDFCHRDASYAGAAAVVAAGVMVYLGRWWSWRELANERQSTQAPVDDDARRRVFVASPIPYYTRTKGATIQHVYALQGRRSTVS
ncbi:MAG: hypothetical protein ACRDL7_03855, partial [Gaiellaceae bacterium]